MFENVRRCSENVLWMARAELWMARAVDVLAVVELARLEMCRHNSFGFDPPVRRHAATARRERILCGGLMLKDFWFVCVCGM